MFNQKNYVIDAATGLIKRALGSAAVTATAYIGTQHDQGAAVATDVACVIDIEAIDIASTNEVYTFRLVASNATDRSDGTVIAMAQVGDASTITIETIDSAAGNRVVLFGRTERDGTSYRYLDLHLTVAGTTGSITFGAYISKVLI
jgi:hypothetical protein